MPRRTLQTGLINLVGGIALALCSLSTRAVEVIAHADVMTSELTVSAARAMFGMRQGKWPDGTLLRVFVLPDSYPLHNAFCKEVLDIFPYQLRQSWDRQVYSGTGQAPIELNSEEQMIERVSRTPGAIGYVKKVSNHDAVRIISVH